MKSELIAVGLNHKGAPIELRERLAIPEEDFERVLARLVGEAGLDEAVLLSTCNRVELYGVGAESSQAGRRVLDGLAELRGVSRDALGEHSFVRGSAAAARHIFRVAASLESMVVGEPQILGQVKDAVQRARDGGLVGPILDRCFSMALHGAKRVRTETDIARGGASVPSVAVDLATSIFGELRGCAALIVGAGEMAEQAGTHLRAAGVSEIVVVNRSEQRAHAMAEKLEGRAQPWARLEHELGRTDIVVTSTGSQLPVIERPVLRTVMKARRHRPIFFVDIAVPRDVDPDVSRLDHVFLYNIDDLQSIVHDNLRLRRTEADRAEAVVDEEVDAFLGWQRSRAVGPMIGRLQQHGREIVDVEVEKALRRLQGLPAEQQAVVQQLGHQIMQKLLHQPMSSVREAAKLDGGAAGAQLAEALQVLFRLEDGAPAAGKPEPGASEDAHAAETSDADELARPEPS